MDRVAGPREQSIRIPAVAGMFYPDDPNRCAEMASALVAAKASTTTDLASACGGIVPHAGWICSGAVAGETIGALGLLASESVDVVVVFGVSTRRLTCLMRPWTPMMVGRYPAELPELPAIYRAG